MCTSNTDLSAVRGASDSGLLVELDGFLMDAANPKSTSCPRGAPRAGLAARAESQPSPRNQTLPRGLWVYCHVWCFISAPGLRLNLERKHRYGRWGGSQPPICWVSQTFTQSYTCSCTRRPTASFCGESRKNNYKKIKPETQIFTKPEPIYSLWEMMKGDFKKKKQKMYKWVLLFFLLFKFFIVFHI